MACGCAYESGAGTRLWIVEVSTCANAPFSTGATFSPVFTGLTTSSASFLCGMESVNISYGSEIQEIFVAALSGTTGTVEGVKKGTFELVIVHDSEAPIGDVLESGSLYDFVLTFNESNPSGSDAADKVVGRFRAGMFQMPINLNGEVIRVTVPGTVDGRVYGAILGSTDA